MTQRKAIQPAPGYVPGRLTATMRAGFPPGYQEQTLHLFTLGKVRPAHANREAQLAAGHASATGRVLGLPGTPSHAMPKWQKRKGAEVA